MNYNIYENILGGILGLAVGDALGVPYEFLERRDMKKNNALDMVGFGSHNKPKGTWSDDTSMTLCLLDAITTGIDYDDIMNNFLSWYEEGKYTADGNVFDIGITTRKAITRYKGGIASLDSGLSGETDNGNGALMRILPISFYLYKAYGRNIFESENAIEIIDNITSLTHGHIRSVIASCIYISIACKLIDGLNIDEALENTNKEARLYFDKRYKEELKHYNRIFKHSFKTLKEEDIESSGYVVHTLEASIWCLLNTSSYKECVLKAVNLGNDTDTTAAVAGGFAGIYYGYEAIPKGWLKDLTKKEYIESLCFKFSEYLKDL